MIPMLALSVNATAYTPGSGFSSGEDRDVPTACNSLWVKRTVGKEVDSQGKYKTEMCRNWQAGFCEFGPKCAFAHGSQELRIRVLVTSKYKTKLCKQFFQLGYCVYGPRCQFRHAKEDMEIRKNGMFGKTETGQIQRRLPVFVEIERRGTGERSLN